MNVADPSLQDSKLFEDFRKEVWEVKEEGRDH